MAERLSQEDVKNLLEDPSPESRASAAGKLSGQFSADALSSEERHIAEDIFRLMVRDVELRVREVLAENLKESPDVPHEVAVSLARDEDSVSLPFIEMSDVLSSDDLIQIVREQNLAKQKAVARRAELAEEVSDVLIEEGKEDAVVTLVSNDTAHISEKGFHRAIDRFGENEHIHTPLVERERLPVTVAERLVTQVSQDLQNRLVQKHDISDSLASDIILRSREKATITLSTESTEDQVRALVAQMHRNGRLTASIILRAICMGDVKFFEYALAELAETSITNTRILIHDSGPLGLQGLYEKAGQPLQFFPAVRSAVDTLQEMEYDGRENDRERFSRRLIERILTRYDEMGMEFEADDIEYLMTKMSELPPTHIET